MKFLPRTLGRTLQLIAVPLLISAGLSIIRETTEGWLEIVVFVGSAAVVIWLWQKLRLHDYFFD